MSKAVGGGGGGERHLGLILARGLQEREKGREIAVPALLTCFY